MSFPAKVRGSVPPFPAVVWASPEDEAFYRRCVAELVQCSQGDLGTASDHAHQLAETLTRLTDAAMTLFLFSSSLSPSPIMEGENAFRVGGSRRTYGFIQVQTLRDISATARMLTLARSLAPICGWQLQARAHLAHLDQQLVLIPPEVLARLGTLSVREQEVLALVGQGHTSAVIAQMLTLSVKTVSTHRRNIYLRLELASTTRLELIALAAGLI